MDPQRAEPSPPTTAPEKPAERTSEYPSPTPSIRQFRAPARPRTRRVLDFWLSWEVFGVLGSALAIVGIVIVLLHYDDQPVPQWSYPLQYRDWSQEFHLTLNAVLALLATIAATCVLIPVTKGLGQLKWVWFIEKDRKLSDLEMFDAATRGVTGSMRLMWRMKFKHFAALGAIASILTLAYGPVVQEVLQYSIQYHAGGQPSLISYCRGYNITNPDDDVGDADRRLKFKIAASLYDISNVWFTPPLQCNTGNCTWDDYATLGVCSRCSDISDQLTVDCGGNDQPSCDVSLPGGFSLGGEEQNHHHLMAINTTFDPLVYTNYTRPLALLQSIIAFDDEQHPSGTLDVIRVGPFAPSNSTIFRARECVLVPCVQFQQFAVVTNSDGLDVTNFGAESLLNVTHEFDEYTVDAETGDVEVSVPRSELEKMANFDTVPDVYRIANASYVAMEIYLKSLLNGFAATTQDVKGFDFHSDGHDRLVNTATEDAMHAIYKNSANGQWTGKLCKDRSDDEYQGDLECAARNMAHGMTVAMRDVSWNRKNDPAKLEGITLYATPWCHVVWVWMALPVAVWALSTIVLIGTWFKTRSANVGLWKTSPLAMLLLSLDQEDLANLRNWHELPEADLLREAGKLRIRLRIGEEGVRIEGIPNFKTRK